MDNPPQSYNQEAPIGGVFPPNQQPVAQTQPPNSADNSVLPNSPKKSKKKLLLATILVLVLAIIVVVAIYALKQHKKVSAPLSKTSSSGQVSKKASTSTPADGLLTYVSNDKSNLIVTNVGQKELAKITNPVGSYSFFIYGNNSATVLAAALTANGSNGQFYLISNSGKIIQVPSSISNNLNNKVGPGYLGYNNNYIYTSCSGGTKNVLQTCDINNLNLSTGQSSTITSSTNSASTPSEDPTLSLAGVSPSNVAYIMSDGNGSEKASLEEVNISSGSTIKTVPLPKLLSPTNTTEYDRLSNDFNNIAYVVSDFITSQTINYEFAITNFNTGNTTTVDSLCDETPSSSSFIYNKTWSPDNNNIAFACQKSSTTFVGDLNVATDKVNILKSLPGSNTLTVINWNTINVEGWSSDSTINFYYKIGQNTSSATYYSINTNTGTVSQPPTPANYELLSPYTY